MKKLYCLNLPVYLQKLYYRVCLLQTCYSLMMQKIFISLQRRNFYYISQEQILSEQMQSEIEVAILLPVRLHCLREAAPIKAGRFNTGRIFHMRRVIALIIAL